MDFLSTHSSLTDVLHALSQALLVPDIILLLLFAGYALFCIGSILAEYFTERRAFKVAMPAFLSALMDAEESSIPEIVRSSGLLNRQKKALLTVFDYRTLPGDALLALIRREVGEEETRYAKITGRNNMAAKISPMLGLMGTLIPLGPGVAALGQADPTQLSASLLVAFDTTVAGLAVAAVCLAVGKIRSTWYNDYLSALESGMATMLQKIEDLRASGGLEAKEPTDFALRFERGLAKDAASARADATPRHATGSDDAAEDTPVPSATSAGAVFEALKPEGFSRSTAAAASSARSSADGVTSGVRPTTEKAAAPVARPSSEGASAPVSRPAESTTAFPRTTDAAPASGTRPGATTQPARPPYSADDGKEG